jgi:uncharacterized RDD family membrane protein YckC
MIWYYAHEGKRVGPVDEAEFEALVETRVITADTLVWNETLPKWLRYAEIGQGAEVRQQTSQSSSSQIFFRDTASQGAARCYECGKSFGLDDMIRYKDTWVCASCKPLFVQRLKEGVMVSGAAMDYGGFWIRFAAKLIDGMIQSGVGFVVGAIFGFVIVPIVGPNNPLTALLSLLMNLFNIALGVAYTTYFLGKHAATPGKMACGLKVVKSDGGKVSYARALGRHFAEWINPFTLWIGYIMAAFDDEKRTLHDRICDTRVIKK